MQHFQAQPNVRLSFPYRGLPAGHELPHILAHDQWHHTAWKIFKSGLGATREAIKKKSQDLGFTREE